MKLSPAAWTALLLTALCAGVAAWAWASLPAGGGVPINYLGLDGLRHNVVTRAALWLLPSASAIVTVSLIVARRRLTEETAVLPLEMTMIAVAGLLLVTQNAVVGRAFQPDFNVLRPVAGATGVLLIAIGNYLGKARRNAVFGLRTPWTLANPSVWDRTHRFTGAGMVAGGVALILLAILLHEATVLGAAIAVCTATPLLAGVVRSAGLYRRLQRS
jgi:uncharacterized membrane protein